MNKFAVVGGVGAAALVGAVVYFFAKSGGANSTAAPSSVSLSDSNYTPFAMNDANSPINIFKSISDGVSSVMNNEPLGIKNNNPLNIKWSSVINWNGQLGQDAHGFVIFDTPENGIRAAARNLKNYSKAGYITIDQIIRNWTRGDGEFTQASYVKAVSGALGVSKDWVVTSSQYPTMLAAMIRQENGKQPYSMATIMAGVNAA